MFCFGELKPFRQLIFSNINLILMAFFVFNIFWCSKLVKNRIAFRYCTLHVYIADSQKGFNYTCMKVIQGVVADIFIVPFVKIQDTIQFLYTHVKYRPCVRIMKDMSAVKAHINLYIYIYFCINNIHRFKNIQ